MGQLLFTTQDMRTAADQMAQAASGLIERIPAILPAGVVMPPTLELETAEAVASVSADLTESSTFYGYNAADLAVRTAMVIAENDGEGVLLAARFALERLGATASSLWSELPVSAALRGAEESLEDARGLIPEVENVFNWADSIYGTVDEFASGLKVFQVIDDSSAGKFILGPVSDVVAALEEVSDTSQIVAEQNGDTVSGGLAAVEITELGTIAVEVYPPTAIANFLTGGLVTQMVSGDGHAIGVGISDAEREYQTGGVVGAVDGFGKGAMQASGAWQTQALQGEDGTVAKHLMQVQSYMDDPEKWTWLPRDPYFL